MSRAPLLDLISAGLESRRRPLDFALVATLEEPAAERDLECGARSARNAFPKSGCVFRGVRWLASDVPMIVRRSGSIEQFMDEPMDLSNEPPIRQWRSGNVLVTRLHHAAGDLVALALWVRHQLQVAHGLSRAVGISQVMEEPALERHANPTSRNPFAWDRPCASLRARRSTSRLRRWHVLEFDAEPLRGFARSAGGCTYNDMLTTAFLQALRLRNGRDSAVGVWFPMNIRLRRFEGFGNGTSRTKLYARFRSEDFAEQCREIREQIRAARERGDWHVPEQMRLPLWALKLYVRRPRVDLGTALFSHAEELPELPGVVALETIGQLYDFYSVVVTGVTLRGTTRLTFTYDPARLDRADIDALVQCMRLRLEEVACRPGGVLP